MTDEPNDNVEYEEYIEEVLKRMYLQYGSMDKEVLKDTVETIIFLLSQFRLGCLLKMVVEVDEVTSKIYEEQEEITNE